MMESLLFDWEGWDELDSAVYQFSSCTFKENFGPFKAGETFDFVDIDYKTGVMSGIKEDGTEKSCKIKLAVAEN